MNDPGVITARLTGGGPEDGRIIRLPADVTRYWVGPIQAGWVTELQTPPESVVGGNLGCYAQTGTTDDGTRIFTWVQPGSLPPPDRGPADEHGNG